MSRLLVENDYKAAHLLQVLHLSANEILVALDTDDWDAIVAHIDDNIVHQFLQLVMTL